MASNNLFKLITSTLVIKDFLLGFQFLGYPLYMYLVGISPYEIGIIYSLEFLSKIAFIPFLHYFKGKERLSYTLSFVFSSIVFLNLALYPSIFIFLVNAILIGLSNSLGSSATVFMGDLERSRFSTLGFFRRVFAALGFLAFYLTKYIPFSTFYLSFFLVSIIPAIISQFIELKPVAVKYKLSINFVRKALRDFSWYLIYVVGISLFTNMIPVVIHYYTGLSVYDEVFYFVLVFVTSSVGAYFAKVVKGKLIVATFILSLLILAFMGLGYYGSVMYVFYSFLFSVVSPNVSYLYARAVNKDIDRVAVISLAVTMITALDNFMEGLVINLGLTSIIFPLASVFIFLGLSEKVKELIG
ncbi:hypothetical protein [Acidianus sp. HS-5]|uniref:hypothetical protein n=1 Tax=Acidianus sp. HS-5 TaxID=2886040 RepID=UPI001F2AC5C8|nr:hypothetical protein [Acidianus sp. HS-5]BDC18753.1 hypothetical protein HS5_16430 [Acidianus sp. HS-5]